MYSSLVHSLREMKVVANSLFIIISIGSHLQFSRTLDRPMVALEPHSAILCRVFHATSHRVLLGHQLCGYISHDRTILICHSPAVLSGRIAKVPTTRTKSKGLVSGPASSFLGFPPRQPGRAYWMPYSDSSLGNFQIFVGKFGKKVRSCYICPCNSHIGN